jgi:hypothetical protein
MLEGAEFAFREGAPVAAGQVTEAKMADAGAEETLHFIADLVKHAADLAVQALSENDAEASRPDLLEMGEPGALAIEENAVEEFLAALRIPAAIERNLVFLFYLVARMGKMLGEIAVAREEQETLGLGIEPADVEEPPKFCRQQIVDRIGRFRVAPGGNETSRLVQDDGEFPDWPNELVIDLDVVARFNLGAEICAELAVYGDAAAGKQLVTKPARAETGGGKESVQAHGALPR